MQEFANEISRHVWQPKYKFIDQSVSERSITDTWSRVARALAAVEPKDSTTPGGRIRDVVQLLRDGLTREPD